MKRDMDLVRSILLAIDGEPSSELSELPDLEGFSHEQIAYHARLLKQAAYINALDVGTFNGEDYIELSLTWDGHEFLETVRDNDLWRKAKNGADRVGNWGVKLIADLALGAARAKAVQLGIPIG